MYLDMKSIKRFMDRMALSYIAKKILSYLAAFGSLKCVMKVLMRKPMVH